MKRISEGSALELFIDWYAVPGDEAIGFVGHADDGHEFAEDFLGHAFIAGGGGVGGDAVVAAVGGADGDVDEFLDEGVEGAGGHDLLDGIPGAFEGLGIAGEGFPEIVDGGDFALGHDVVIDGADLWGGVLVFDEFHGDSRRRTISVWPCSRA